MRCCASRVLALGAALACIALLTGCAYNIGAYGSSAEVVEIIKRQNLPPIALAKFSAPKPGKTSIFCRGVGPMETPGKVSFESYIEDALRNDLKLAGIYDPNAKIVLGGTLDKVDIESHFSDARWVLALTVSTDKAAYSVASEHVFPTSFSGTQACRQTIVAFIPAVQQLFREVVTDPRFKSLFGP